MYGVGQKKYSRMRRKKGKWLQSSLQQTQPCDSQLWCLSLFSWLWASSGLSGQVLWTVDHTFSITCHYFHGYYTDIILLGDRGTRVLITLPGSLRSDAQQGISCKSITLPQCPYGHATFHHATCKFLIINRNQQWIFLCRTICSGP